MVKLDILELFGVVLISSIVGAGIMFSYIEDEVVSSNKKVKELQAELNSSSSCTDLFLDSNGELFYIEHIKEKAN